MRHLLVLAVVALGWGWVGCSSGDKATPVADSGSTTSPKVPTHPAGRSAYQFLTAVVQGDTTAANNRLTPRSVEQFRKSGKRFAPPGLGSATFEISKVIEASKTEAMVQCLLSNQEAEGGSEEGEEMICLMQLVEGEWRVNGIAYDTGDKEPLILNFEKPNFGLPTQTPRPSQFVERPVAGSSNPQTAQRKNGNPLQ